MSPSPVARMHRVAAAAVVCASIARAQAPATAGAAAEGPAHPHLLGIQSTSVLEGAPAFPSPFAGPSSLRGGVARTSQTVTLFLGVRALDGLDVYLEPEAAAGSAPGEGGGLAGYGNGDLIGQPGRLDAYVARAFVRWRTALGPQREPQVRIGRARYLVEQTVPARRLVVTVGRLAVTDLLDQSLYANSPRTQFLNLAFTNGLAYDYPQDLHGYSRGVFVDYVSPPFAARAASFAVPSGPGGALSWDLLHARADALELTFRPRLPWVLPHRGALRLLAWRNEGLMGRYADALRAAAGGIPSLAAVRRPGTVRSGVALNVEMPLADGGATGAFARAGVASGGVEALSFAECDRAVSAGVQLSGMRWRRGDDVVGLAVGLDLVSEPHRAYLAAGGTGLRLGDGALRYGPDIDSEVYYSLQVVKAIALSADVQGIVNPGYDRARGPVVLLSLRAHVEL